MLQKLHLLKAALPAGQHLSASEDCPSGYTQGVTGSSPRNLYSCQVQAAESASEHKCPYSPSLLPVPPPFPVHWQALQEPRGATLPWKPSLWELNPRLSFLVLVEVSHNLKERKIWKSLATQARLLHLAKAGIHKWKHFLGQPPVGTAEDNDIFLHPFQSPYVSNLPTAQKR